MSPEEELSMVRESLEGRWKQFRGEMKKLWGEISDDEFDQADGERDRLCGLIQQHYGRTREEALEEVDRFFGRYPRTGL